jgi:exopolysaccharide production protein ExoQ
MADQTHSHMPGGQRPVLFSVVGLAILVMCWIQFTGAWIWPPLRKVEWGVIEIHPDKPGGVLFQYPLWLLIMAGAALAILKDGMGFIRAFTPFSVMFVFMITASIFGMSMMASSRITLLWLLSALAGGVVASLLERQTILKALAVVILVTMVLSLLSYLLLPAYGADRYYNSLVLRGVYIHKNTAGAVAALSVTLLWVMRRDLPRGLLLPALGFSLACLLLSESKTGWVSALLAISCLTLLDMLRRRVTPALGLLVLASVALLGSLLILSSAAVLADALGRDLTLTGRTAIWQSYLAEIRHVLWLGAGPGNVTTPSPFTAKLSLELRAHGSIFSPHSFYIGTLGDIGLGGLLYTLLLFGFLTFWLPLRHQGPFTLPAAAVGLATLIGGLSETMDAAQPGSTWFFLALFWTSHCLKGAQSQAPAAAAEADRGPRDASHSQSWPSTLPTGESR